ncbi:MAG: hypothetical protein JF595_11880 [Sphingomonadales bacterium]|nr:hypothetical protein [Sphingomonadales bacterium]
METGAKALGWLRNAVLAVFVTAILAGMFLPIYTDEIGWRLQERAGFEGVDKLFVDICGPNTIVRPPFWMMPARYYSALFNSLFADPIYFRISGILYALAWMGLVLLLVRRVADRAADRIALSCLAIGFMSLGTMPLLLVMSRPEQPILLAFTGALLIAASDWKREGADTPTRTAWWRSLAILLLALVAMSYHVKAVFTAPLFLVCLMCATRGSRALAPRLILGAILLAAAGWAAFYWVDRFSCPNNALVRADFMRNTGMEMVHVTNPLQILPVLKKALGNVSIFLFPGLPAPRPEPMAGWLPAGKISFADSFSWFLVLCGIWAVALVASAFCLVRAAERGWRERKLDRRIVLAAALLVTVVGWSATGFVSIYEASFAVPMMVYAVILALSTHEASSAHRGARFATGIRLGAATVGLMGIVSIALVAMLYGPSLAAAAHERGYIKEQPLSISVFGYAGLKRDMLAAARKCGISDPDAGHALLIDDVTYFTFMKSRLPQHRYGLFHPIAPIKDPIGYLRWVRSDGVIASCHALPAEFRARAQRQGQFCCLAPPNW